MDLFAALNTATGTVIGKTSARQAAQDFTAFLDEIDRRVEPDLAVHLICDLSRPRDYPDKSVPGEGGAL